MTATRKNRGSSSRAAHSWMISFDRGQGSWLRRLFHAEPAAGEPGGRCVVFWLTLAAGGLTVRRQNCGPYNSAKHFACGFVVDCQNPIREVVSGFFFFVGTAIVVSSPDAQHDVQRSKCISYVLERLLRTSGHHRPDTCDAFPSLSKSWSPNGADAAGPPQVGTDIPPSTTRSSFSAFSFTVTYIVRVTARGAATTLAISSSSLLLARRSPN